MMSDKKLIVVKEAQEMDFFKRSNENIELFNNYLEKPNTSSLLVICHKNKSLDKRSKLYKSFLKNSTILDSSSKENKIYDNQLPTWINRQVTESGYEIDDKSTFLIAENVGNNLERIYNSLDKIMSNKEDKTFLRKMLLSMLE